MTAADWHRVKEVCAEALERPPAERAAFLDRMCAGDPALRAEVESLLEAHDDAGEFIAQPALSQLPATVDDLLGDPNIGRSLGPYVIESVIGRGGMGAVYEARRADREFDHRVAIKMIRRGMDSDVVVQRFRNERQILASLDHPNIARLFDGGTTHDGLPYFVMEYVDGLPIDQFADAHRLTTAERLRLCLPVFDAVQHAHDRSIVHRDIKPRNVLVTHAGHPKLLDFGIAKILDPADGSQTVTFFGRAMTPDYASPEQVQGLPITPATDVYALGVLLYEVLTGHRPFSTATTTPAESARIITEEDPERPSTVIDKVIHRTRDDGTEETITPTVLSERRDGTPERLREHLSGALDAIILKALRKEPEARYASVEAFAADVRRYLATEPVEAERDARRYRARRWVRRHRTWLAAAALVVVAVASTALVTWSAVDPAAPAPASTSVPSSTAGRRSVAIAPFRMLSGNAADAWLSTAIPEMLTTELAGDGQLRVIPADQMARVARDLGVDFASAPDATALASLRGALGADLLVSGTFVTTGQGDTRAIRVDLRVHAAGDVLVAAAATQGEPAQLFGLVADASNELRRRMGLKEAPPDATTAARAAFPSSVDATRLYAEGMARLRVLDANGARERLESAAALEPGNPMIQTALASAWSALGYDARAAAAAQRAFDASGALGREERLNVEGRLYEARQEWDKATDVYRTLWGFFSDNLEYGLHLARAQTAGGRAGDALATVATMRQLPPPQSEDPRIALEEAEALWELGDFTREFEALQRARSLAGRSGERGLMARSLALEGRNLRTQGRPAEAIAALRESERLFREVGDRAGEAYALRLFAAVLRDQQDITQALRINEASLRTSEEIGDRQAMSAALTNIGIILKDQRQFAEALAAHRRALALRREIADDNGTAISLNNIGVVLYEQDRFAEAAAAYGESLAVTTRTGDRRMRISAQHNRAIIDREIGNLAAARAAYEESLALRREIGDRRGEGIGLVELGMVQLAQGEIDAARRTLEQALAVAREVRLRPGEGQALFQLGDVALATGDLPAARAHHEGALAVRREIKETRTVLESRTALAWLRFEEGRPEQAEREGRSVLADLGDEPAGALRAALTVLAARARLSAGDLDGAARALADAHAAADSSERIEVQRLLAMADAELALARGQAGRARDHLTQLGARLSKAGMRLAELDRRLLLLRIDAAEGRPIAAAAAQLVRDAEGSHAGLVAQRARMLAR